MANSSRTRPHSLPFARLQQTAYRYYYDLM